MPIRLKFGNDLNISGSSRGAGNSISQPAGGGGFPPYGTVLSTGYANYEIGGTAYSNILATFVYTQYCTVNTVADGVGGSFIDWSSATSINYKPYGESIAVAASSPMDWGSLEVPTGSGNFCHNYYTDGYEEVHGGTGTIVSIPNGYSHWFAYGYVYVGYNTDNQTEVPSGSSQYFPNGMYEQHNYIADGSGGYTDVYVGTYGSFYSNGTEVDSSLRYNNANLQSEVPDPSGYFVDNGKYEIYTYYWDGSGNVSSGYFDIGGSFYNWGDYIYNDGTYDYYWDGYGGYYTV